MVLDYSIPPTWKWTRLGDVAKVLLSNVDKKVSSHEHPVRLCNYTDVYYNRYIDSTLPLSEGSASDRELGKFRLREGDVIITKDSEDRHDIAVPALVTEDLPNVLCGYHLAIIRPKNRQLDGGFLSVLLQCHEIRHMFSRLANGVTRFGLTVESIEHARLPLPPIGEQRRVSLIVRSFDEAATKLDLLIKAKELHKRALMQQLLTGGRRFPEFTEPWKMCRLGELFRERKETGRDDLPLLSVTNGRGVIPRGEVDRKDSSNPDKSAYKRIAPGDIGYNTMRMWQGVSALSDLEGIVSPAYTICTPTEQIDARFAAHLFKLPEVVHLFYRYSQGLVDDTLQLRYSSFAAIKVTIPRLDEQRKIAAVLDAADREIALLRRELELVRKQKRGLMQKLLTGEIRVNGA